MEIKDFDKVVKWSYNLAREWAIDNLVPQGVTSARKFDQYKRQGKYLPRKYPRIPDEYFKRKGSWKGWRDFLGYPKQDLPKNYLSYEDAVKTVRRYDIHNSKAYMKWKERPANLPARPEYHYEEWKGWEEFLGPKYKRSKPRNYSKLTINEVRIIKHQLSLGVSGAILAKEFGVSEMQISRIRHGENWGEI